MKILATLFLTLSLPGTRLAPPLRSPEAQASVQPSHKTGKWYLAENGHAVFCYGPVMLLKQPQGQLQRVATFCRNGQAIVPLRD